MTSDLSEDSYRLGRAVRPARYRLRVATDFESSRFDGEVEIELDVAETVEEIVLNAAELELAGATLSGGGAPRELSVRLDEALDRAHLGDGAQIEAGSYTLTCSFAAPLGSRLRGYYRSSFTDADGETRHIASTHFEPTDARRAFPCFDEPEMKARFAITLVVRDGLFAVSNGPELASRDLGDGRREVSFKETIPISSYLVCYAVGPFEATEPVMADGTVPLRVVVPRGKLGLTAFALEAASHALTFFHRYFDLPYPAEKLDMVAIPDFAMGAMENLGCITYREQDLLCDEESSSLPELTRIAEVVAHEIAHMWFGDLVTMRWWNGIWLNEAFATFMSIACEDDFRPTWKRWESFRAESELALQLDGLHSTRAIEYPVNAPDEAEAMFDLLTYEKGASVLRMIEGYVGPELFRAGVRSYLATHAYANTETTDLFDAIASAAGEEGVRQLFDAYILKGGYPLVTARPVNGGAVVSCEPFSYLPEEERPANSRQSAIGSSFLVPLSYELRPGRPRRALIGEAPGISSLEVDPGGDLLVVNAGGAGVYRVHYEGELSSRVLSCLAELSPIERFNLVADLFATTLAGKSAASEYISLLRRLSSEGDPNIWGTVASSLRLIDFATAGLADEALALFVGELLRPELDRIGFQPSSSDSPDVARLRPIFLRALGTLGFDEEVIAYCNEAFRRDRAGEEALAPSTAEAVLEVVAASGDRQTFDEVLAGYRQPTDPLSEARHLMALTRFTDTELAGEVLAMTRDGIRLQDVPRVLARLVAYRPTGPLAWEYLKVHYDEIDARVAHSALPHALVAVSYLVQPDERNEIPLVADVAAFAAGRQFGGSSLVVEQALERQRVNARFVEATRPLVQELLARA